MDYGTYRPPRKRTCTRIDEYFNRDVHEFFEEDWTVELENIEIELEDVWNKCVLYRNRIRKEHVCILFERGLVEGEVENLGYTFDRNTMKLYDTTGDEIAYKRSMRF